MRLGQFGGQGIKTWASAYGSSCGYVLNVAGEPIDKIDSKTAPAGPSYVSQFVRAYVVSHLLLFILLIAGAMASKPMASDQAIESGPGALVVSGAIAHALFSLPFFLLAFLWARKTREILPISVAYGCALVPMYALSCAVLFLFANEHGGGLSLGAWGWFFGALGFLAFIRSQRPEMPST